MLNIMEGTPLPVTKLFTYFQSIDNGRTIDLNFQIEIIIDEETQDTMFIAKCNLYPMKSDAYYIEQHAINDIARKIFDFLNCNASASPYLAIENDTLSIFTKETLSILTLVLFLLLNMALIIINETVFINFILVPLFVANLSILTIPFALNFDSKLSHITSNRINARSSKKINEYDLPIRFLKYGEYVIEQTNSEFVVPKLDRNQALVIANKEIRFDLISNNENEDPQYVIPSHRGFIITQYISNGEIKYRARLKNVKENGEKLTYENNEIPRNSFFSKQFQIKNVISKFGYHYVAVQYTHHLKNIKIIKKHRIITLVYLEWVSSIVLTKLNKFLEKLI